MPHIHTEPGQHDNSVTTFIVRTDMDEPRILFQMHRSLHTLMPPGGHVEVNESPWAALLHEVEEEAGYTTEELQVMQPVIRLKSVSQIVLHPIPIVSNTHYISDGHFHTDLDYFMIADGPPGKAPAEGESQDLRWLSRDDIAAAEQSELWDNVREIALYVLDELLGSSAYEPVEAIDYRTDVPQPPINTQNK